MCQQEKYQFSEKVEKYRFFRAHLLFLKMSVSQNKEIFKEEETNQSQVMWVTLSQEPYSSECFVSLVGKAHASMIQFVLNRQPVHWSDVDVSFCRTYNNRRPVGR